MSHNVRFVVVDFETTGIGKWGNDRIVEVAALRLDSDGNILEEFVTLINPHRDVGPTSRHGITASDVAEAPTFDVVAGDIFHILREAVFVAHNVHFDMRFLRLEACRLDIDLPDFPYLCTMQLATQIAPNLPGRALESVCSHLGITLERAHSAEADARATAQVLRMGLRMFSDARGPDLEKLGVSGGPRSARNWPSRPRKRRILTRGKPGEHLRERQHMIDRLIARLPASSEEVSRADEYLMMLDSVLEDRKITTDEIDILCSVASQIGLSQEQIRLLHERYLQDLVSLALGDGIISEFEDSDLHNVQTLLGISSTRYEEIRKVSLRDDPIRNAARRECCAMIGRSVCFTGDLQLKLDGRSISQTDAELIAKNKGLVVKENVTKDLDFLVAADPETQSIKGTLARKHGVKILSEPVFWQRLGVDGSSNTTTGSHNRVQSDREYSISVRTPLHTRMENGAKPFAGKTLVVTGTLEGYSRTQIETLIKQFGGKAAKSVSKKTDYLVAGEKAGSKLAKAESLGVTVLSKEAFLDLIGKSGATPS